jgi:vacuolar-type H+-ATPase subunit H
MAEAIAIVGLVDACIGITETIIKIGQAAKNAQGLPSKLAKVFEEFPVVQSLFQRAKENSDNIKEDARRSAKPILKQCKEALDQLQTLFEKICPPDDTSSAKRIWKGAKAEVMGRNSKLQELWNDVQGHLGTLETKQVFDIGDKLDALKETMDSLAEESGDNYKFYGSGSQNINNGPGKLIVAGGGSNNQYTQTFS